MEHQLTPGNTAQNNSLLTEAEAAAYLRLAPATLATWRSTGRVSGPAYVKLGGSVRYPRKSLENYLETCTVVPGAK